MTIEATSKEDDYSKHCVQYLQSWHMGITNKLLHTALWKRTHSSRQPDDAIVVTCRHVTDFSASYMLVRLRGELIGPRNRGV